MGGTKWANRGCKEPKFNLCLPSLDLATTLLFGSKHFQAFSITTLERHKILKKIGAIQIKPIVSYARDVGRKIVNIFEKSVKPLVKKGLKTETKRY